MNDLPRAVVHLEQAFQKANHNAQKLKENLIFVLNREEELKSRFERLQQSHHICQQVLEKSRSTCSDTHKEIEKLLRHNDQLQRGYAEQKKRRKDCEALLKEARAEAQKERDSAAAEKASRKE